MVDALVVWAEEGRLLAGENNGEAVSSRYQPLVSEWGNLSRRKSGYPDLASGWAPGEPKHPSTRRKRNHMRLR
jgi:hypothetical protein